MSRPGRAGTRLNRPRCLDQCRRTGCAWGRRSGRAAAGTGGQAVPPAPAPAFGSAPAAQAVDAGARQPIMPNAFEKEKTCRTCGAATHTCSAPSYTKCSAGRRAARVSRPGGGRLIAQACRRTRATWALRSPARQQSSGCLLGAAPPSLQAHLVAGRQPARKTAQLFTPPGLPCMTRPADPCQGGAEAGAPHHRCCPAPARRRRAASAPRRAAAPRAPGARLRATRKQCACLHYTTRD